MFNEALREFLLESNRAGYSGGDEKKWIKEKDGSTTIPFEIGEFRMHDNFFGGEPYGGRLVVFHKSKPVWIMVYYGKVEKGTVPDSVYPVLRKALKNMPENAPFRGPTEISEGDYIYNNSWSGDITGYSGEETITASGKIVYKANYFGGLVDARKGT